MPTKIEKTTCGNHKPLTMAPKAHGILCGMLLLIMIYECFPHLDWTFGLIASFIIIANGPDMTNENSLRCLVDVFLAYF